MSLLIVDPTLLASLPSELHLIILEYAASSLATALSLSLVSTWVHTLVQPYLYHTVVLSTSRALSSFHTTLSSKPRCRASTHVKHLGIFAPGPVETIDKILSLCHGIDSLACGFSLPSYKEFQPSPPSLNPISSIKEQHLLSLSCRDGWDVSLVSPTVTHLRVHITSPQRPWFAMPGAGANTTLEASNWDLSYLPHLTHLGIVWKPAKGQKVEDVLVPLTRLLGSSNTEEHDKEDADNEHLKLQVILIQILGTRASRASAVKALNDAAIKQGGRALRVVGEAAPLSAVSQWEDGVRGGERRAVWEKAERVVLGRLREVPAVKV
ncbi:hypothetical protein BDY19DRAFT_406137 [Irpex rosettiformis]|uniref:Uncharacterized protein n=1 Tax=Irpex rosettiformis TaxID=378272 RepID=A0ACB8UFK2_9APHY|nr:hypothetical protein BDY19DRAFT_406137 [Irpex rosettiformis]